MRPFRVRLCRTGNYSNAGVTLPLLLPLPDRPKRSPHKQCDWWKSNIPRLRPRCDDDRLDPIAHNSCRTLFATGLPAITNRDMRAGSVVGQARRRHCHVNFLWWRGAQRVVVRLKLRAFPLVQLHPVPYAHHWSPAYRGQ
jgi:hypothetical protein